MPTGRIEHHPVPLLYPFPEGWYFVASRQSILQATLIQKTWLGEEIVAWCDAWGNICVAQAVCPHLGAQLGPATGGLVRDSRLVCPFHGFQFDVSGQCVATPFAAAPRTTKLMVFETREVLGMVFAWWGRNGRPPQWRLPEGSANRRRMERIGISVPSGFPAIPRRPARMRWTWRTCAMCTATATSAGWGRYRWRAPASRAASTSNAPPLSPGSRTFLFDVSAVTYIFGLGYSQVDIHERSIGMDLRLWVLATPIDGKLIDLVLVGQVREIRKPKRPIMGLRFLPPRLRTRIMNRIMMSVQERDVLQDVVIWGRKRYHSRPRLCQSDGEIEAFRRYCQQFLSG